MKTCKKSSEHSSTSRNTLSPYNDIDIALAPLKEDNSFNAFDIKNTVHSETIVSIHNIH